MCRATILVFSPELLVDLGRIVANQLGQTAITKRMRSYSTPESAYRGEVTKLAIAEALASVALYVGICTYVESWRSLAVIVVGAPLMLFRTEVSADWGLRQWSRWPKVLSKSGAGNFELRRIDSFREFRATLFPVLYLIAAIMVFMVATPFAGVALRVIGTIYWAIRRPLYTLREAPKNWVRQTLCTDFMHPPELMPMEALKGQHNNIILENLVRFIRQETGSKKLFIIFVLSPIFLIGYLPSALYRISFKATSVVYAPFIWATHATAASDLPLKVRLERITKGELEKVRRGFSWIVIGVMSAKAGLALGLVDPKALAEKFATSRAAELFLVPGGWPWWQFTLLTDAVLTFILLFFADAALARLESPHPWPERAVLDVTSTISFVRVTLSLLTIAHFFGMALRIAFPAVAWPW